MSSTQPDPTDHPTTAPPPLTARDEALIRALRALPDDAPIDTPVTSSVASNN
ncbi:hypothetical protein ACIGO9_30110 [Nocardia asteroides]|uniref:hypothetical protein n=1 Tax=Nocardia asteroides TaxID=1824 RepID=UPI0037C75417